MYYMERKKKSIHVNSVVIFCRHIFQLHISLIMHKTVGYLSISASNLSQEYSIHLCWEDEKERETEKEMIAKNMLSKV